MPANNIYFCAAYKMMRSASVRFLLGVLVITAICVVCEVLWKLYLPALGMSNPYVLLGLFVVIVSALHLFLLNSVEGRPQKFIRAFMASMGLKLLLFMLVLAGFLMLTAENPKSVILHFLLYYTLFTILEVAMLFKGVQK